MASEQNNEEFVVTQLTVGGFPDSTTAERLAGYLGNVLRCRIKRSWTPPGSFPNFKFTDTSFLPTTTDVYEKVKPHAFVHFASHGAAVRAVSDSKDHMLFLDASLLKASFGPNNAYSTHRRSRKVKPYKLAGVSLEIGTLASQHVFFVSWRAQGVDFLVDPFDNTCRFCFTKSTAFSFHKGPVLPAVINCEFKLEFLVKGVRTVRQSKDSEGGSVLLLQLASPPIVSYRTADDDVYQPDLSGCDLLDDDDNWIRTIDFTQSGAIGRCLSYRVLIPARYAANLTNILTYLRKQRVQEEHVKWPPRIRDDPCFGEPLSGHFFCIHHKEGISFELMFLVNSLLHMGIFNQFQLTEPFFDLLRNQPRNVNMASLKHLCTYKRPVVDACDKLKRVQEWILKNPKLLASLEQSADISEARRLVISPTSAYCMPPEAALSNRVLREFNSDRFMRVTFMDEGMQTLSSHALSYFLAPLVTGCKLSEKTLVFDRASTVLTDGFQLCGRKYSFLAFSSNQLSDRSAWFFAEEEGTSVSDVIKWMGNFKDKIVAKFAARMGLCFSSTYASVDVLPCELDTELPDIQRNGYVFSDGIGTITPDLASEVLEKLKLDVKPSCSPCAYQIRYAGFEGVVARWPSKGNGIRLALRPSMNKFQSNHTMLEICSWARFLPCFLNRQIIILLSSLDVDPEVFMEMQETMLTNLKRIRNDTNTALEVLTASCPEQGKTAAIMLSAGFKPETEPYLRGMLSSVRITQLRDLRERSRIYVSSGRCLMGCLDEAGILEQGQCFIKVSKPPRFSKYGSRFIEKEADFEVITGYVAIAKNPCLHPGDVRILEAVDVTELHHMYDCLIFPQKGDRPHPNEASGSDLDGDLYFVTWDQKLIPPSRKSLPAMEYDTKEVKTLDRPVNHKDITSFLISSMADENLGMICNAHVALCDVAQLGAKDDRCIKLARLAAIAVDSKKTGIVEEVPPELKPKLYPDFMGKKDFQTYESKNILGRLYREVKEVDDEDVEASSEENSYPYYDSDLQLQGFEDFVSEAWDHKCSYDRELMNLLQHYNVRKEEEIVTGHISSVPESNKKHGDLEERLKHLYNALKKRFRNVFEETTHENLTKEEKDILYASKASAWYYVTYHPDWIKKSLELRDPDESSSHGVMLSFAWIAADYLASIKKKI